MHGSWKFAARSIVCILALQQSSRAEGVGIVWDRATDRVVSHTDNAAAYPRARVLSNGEILLGYHHGAGQGEYGASVALRRSQDAGRTWSQTFDVEKPGEPQFWGFSNIDFMEIGEGSLILVTAARGKAQPGEDIFPTECARSSLRLRFSNDFGATWSEPTAVADGRGRVWEPSLVQLPSGDLEIYYACEAPDLMHAGRLDQRIEVVRSMDRGRTWSAPKEVSQHPGARNGMPAAIVLSNGLVACAQEVVREKLSPIISFTRNGSRVEEEVAQQRYGFGAAPAMLRLPDTSVLLAFHSGFQRPPAPPAAPVAWMFTNVWVQRGDAEARDFGPGSQPWPEVDERSGLFFPSLFMKDAETVVVLASRITQPGDETTSRTEIRWIEGKLRKAPAR